MVSKSETYSGCQKNIPVFERFFLQPYTRLCRVSLIRNKIMKSGIIILTPKIKSYFVNCLWDTTMQKVAHPSKMA